MATSSENSHYGSARANRPESAEAGARPSMLAPRADIFEDNEKVRILLDMPGVDSSGLDVSLEKDILTVEGHMKPANVDRMRVAHQEFGEGDYVRTFTISNAINRDAIAASIKDGVVELVLPKKEEVKPKKIPVRAA